MNACVAVINKRPCCGSGVKSGIFADVETMRFSANNALRDAPELVFDEVLVIAALVDALIELLTEGTVRLVVACVWAKAGYATKQQKNIKITSIRGRNCASKMVTDEKDFLAKIQQRLLPFQADFPRLLSRHDAQ